MSTCIHCIVSGRVQGVFYRASTQEKALQLGLTGWVRNMPNGDVELEACGSKEQVGQFHEWLWQGPAHAVVSDVVCKSTGGESVIDDFEVRY